MINQIDITLAKLLEAAPVIGVLAELNGADVSFETPKSMYAPTHDTVNLFLYETKENRELRDPLPITQSTNGMSARRRPPLRVDCAYMVTTWSDGATESEKVAASHRLLGQAFNWLYRFPVIPDQYLLAAGMTGQVFAPPTMVAQMDGAKSAGEFWHALGIPPRPYFNLIVTITMDLDQQIEDAIVTTVTTGYHGSDPAPAEERVMIGGTVRDKGGNTVPDAWVRLEPNGMGQSIGETQVTDASGRFTFNRLVPGMSISLRARSPGLGETVPLDFNIPSYSGEYDLQFP